VEALGTNQPSTFAAPTLTGRNQTWVIEMNRFSKLIFVPVAAAVLVACGGGGSDAPTGAAPVPTAATPPVTTPPVTTPPVTTPPVTNYTKEQVRLVASLGALTPIVTANEVSNVLIFVGSFIQSASSATSGTSTVPAGTACATSGTYGSRITKSMVRTGFAVDDSAALEFVNCDFGTGVVLHGALSIVMKSDASALAAGSYGVASKLIATSFEMRFPTSTSKASGIIDSEYIVADAGNSSTMSFNVPTGQLFDMTRDPTGGALNLSYAAGTTFKAVDVVSPNSASRKLDGQVDISTATTNATPLTIAMPTALSGTIDSAGNFVATTGAMSTKATNMNLATSVSVSGTTTTVNGDTDKNGVMDLVFTTTWEALLL
jgi:large repetitive protein